MRDRESISEVCPINSTLLVRWFLPQVVQSFYEKKGVNIKQIAIQGFFCFGFGCMSWVVCIVLVSSLFSFAPLYIRLILSSSGPFADGCRTAEATPQHSSFFFVLMIGGLQYCWKYIP